MPRKTIDGVEIPALNESGMVSVETSLPVEQFVKLAKAVRKRGDPRTAWLRAAIYEKLEKDKE